jgi:flavin reductase (NADH)/flavin reductase
LTATAVCSVSAEPPVLLCCIERTRGSYAAIVKSGAFGVNVLAAEDRDLAARFARPASTTDKFAFGAWRIDGGSPLLETALTAFDCTLVRHIEIGSHGVLFGLIEAAHLRPDQAYPLLYADGDYGVFDRPPFFQNSACLT